MSSPTTPPAGADELLGSGVDGGDATLGVVVMQPLPMARASVCWSSAKWSRSASFRAVTAQRHVAAREDAGQEGDQPEGQIGAGDAHADVGSVSSGWAEPPALLASAASKPS
jgi:hypothetical protein